MNSKLSILLFALTLFSGVGCMHLHKVEGRQAEDKIPEGVRVGIGGKEVKEGDKVVVVRPKCHTTYSPRRGKGKECHDKEAGSALVLKVLDHDMAIVQPLNGLVMDETMKVEKEEPEDAK